mmetsp:Transcript_31353/g.65610  ORF Transcript_31353/g.65610 Transcript_31353/m.65610 type:complete len:242 (-) Transcript_31353:1446-2171(-)
MSSFGSFLRPYLDPSPERTERANVLDSLMDMFSWSSLDSQNSSDDLLHTFSTPNLADSLNQSTARRSAALILFGVALNLTKASSFIVNSSQLHSIHSQQSTNLNRSQPNKSLEFEQFELKQPLKVASDSNWMVHHPRVVAETEFQESRSSRQRKHFDLDFELLEFPASSPSVQRNDTNKAAQTIIAHDDVAQTVAQSKSKGARLVAQINASCNNAAQIMAQQSIAFEAWMQATCDSQTEMT